jgi:hypothetical protein
MPRTIECELTEDMVDQCVPGVWSSGVPAAHAVHAPYSIHVQRTASTSRTTYNAATRRASPAQPHACQVRANASGSKAASARVQEFAGMCDCARERGPWAAGRVISAY